MPTIDLVGHIAPDFDLDSSSGPVKLSSLRGQTVILYFYPKADTPGCTAETCAFRDLNSEFEKVNATILGISRDSVKAQQKFAEKYRTSFPLLSDPDGVVCEAYGVWVEKSMFGKKYMGIERTTFVIDPEGKIENVYPKVKVLKHAQKILNELQAVSSTKG